MARASVGFLARPSLLFTSPNFSTHSLLPWILLPEQGRQAISSSLQV